MRRKVSAVFLLASVWFLVVPAAHAQAAASKDGQAVSEQDIQLLRQDIRSQKKQLIAANLTLSDSEAQRYALIKEYAQNFGSLTDEQSLSLVTRSLALDEAVEQLRIKYVPIVNKVLPGKKTATFFQIDRRITALIDLQLASQIPLVQEQR